MAAEQETAKPWQWWRDESWWRGVAEKAAAGLLVALLVKPTVWPWVLGAATAGLVALVTWWLVKRLRAHRAARASRLARRAASPPRHSHARLRRRPGLPPRPALFPFTLLVGAIVASILSATADLPDEPSSPPGDEQTDTGGVHFP